MNLNHMNARKQLICGVISALNAVLEKNSIQVTQETIEKAAHQLGSTKAGAILNLASLCVEIDEFWNGGCALSPFAHITETDQPICAELRNALERSGFITPADLSLGATKPGEWKGEYERRTDDEERTDS